MWADDFLAAERAHLLMLLLWAGGSALAGAALAALAAARAPRPPLLLHFGVQMLAWGALEVAAVGLVLRALHLPDYAAATRAVDGARVAAGAGVALLVFGLAAAALDGFRRGRLSALGAGTALALHGAALLLLATRFLRLVRV